MFLSAAIFGVTRSEIRARFDEIVAFSGIAGFIDEPVKTYSSGMIVRLGFSVAAHLDSDILLLDEVLAVGDVAFQVRCLDRIAEIRRSGRTILLVSHDLAAVERLCDRALLLQGGEVQADGPPRDVVEAYQALAGAALAQSGAEPASGPLAFRGIAFANPAGGSARTGDPLDVRVALDAAEVIDDALCTVSFMWPSGYLCTELVSQPGRIDPGPTEVLFEVPRLAMQRGLYTVDLMVASRGRTLIQRKRIAPFRVDPGVITRGDFHMDHRSVVRARGE